MVVLVLVVLLRVVVLVGDQLLQPVLVGKGLKQVTVVLL
jgi:hypothetical protein